MHDPHTASFQSSCFSFRHCKTSNSLGIVCVTGDRTLPCARDGHLWQRSTTTLGPTVATTKACPRDLAPHGSEFTEENFAQPAPLRPP